MIRSNQKRSNIWRTLAIFLIVFTILSESYLVYKIIRQNYELNAKQTEIQALLKIIHKANNGKFSKDIVPKSIAGSFSASSEDLVSAKEFNRFKKEYSGKLKKLQRELNTLKKNSLISAK